MDPNANLLEQERIITSKPAYARGHHEWSRLRELRTALIEWLHRGGFEPDWTQAPNASRYLGFRRESR